MTNRDRAARGAQAFAAVVCDQDDPITGVGDLVVDLLHYAETLRGAVQDPTAPGEMPGEYCLRMAQLHYPVEVQGGVGPIPRARPETAPS